MSAYKNVINSLYLYRNGYLETLNKQRFNGIVGGNIIFRLRIILTNTFKEFTLLFVKNPKLNIKGKIVCVINSANNYESLKFLKSPGVVYLKPTVLGNNIQNVITYRFKSKFFYSLLFIIYLPYILLDKLNRRDLILLHKAFGLTSLFSAFLKKQRPRLVVFANDHIPDARSFILACKNLGVNTAYIQHGSVSKFFPPLEFNLALLESQYSKDIYKLSEETRPRIELIGIPKLDVEIFKTKKRTKIKTVGVAINQNDDLPKVEKLLEVLTHSGYKVILRKHPADIRKITSKVNIQDGNNIGVFDFIHASDFIIASDSSIHVEANSLLCRSIYFKMHSNHKKYDYYGYVKNDYIDEAKTISDLCQKLLEFDYSTFNFFSNKMLYYNSAMESSLYGRSSEVSKEIILNNPKNVND